MGHLLLEVNPEDAFERQPVRGARGLVVCAARLDNRDALLRFSDIPAATCRRSTDGHLVSMAFDRWGEDVCPHLEGDWAFAAWDPNCAGYFWPGRFGRRALLLRGERVRCVRIQPEGVAGSARRAKGTRSVRLAENLLMWHQSAELTAYKGFRVCDRSPYHNVHRRWLHWRQALLVAGRPGTVPVQSAMKTSSMAFWSNTSVRFEVACEPGNL